MASSCLKAYSLKMPILQEVPDTPEMDREIRIFEMPDYDDEPYTPEKSWIMQFEVCRII